MSTEHPASKEQVYREALERIVAYELHPFVPPDPAAVAEQSVCVDCKRCAERGWPPSHLCDKHYRALVCDREKSQHHAELCVKYELRDIAREALRG